MPYHPYQQGNQYDYTFNMFNPTYQPRIEHFNSGNNKSLKLPPPPPFCRLPPEPEPYGQCGGKGWNGSKSCPDGSICQYQSEWYSQCKPMEE